MDGLRATGARVLRAVDEDDPRNLTVETGRAFYRVRIEKGWISEGRVRFNPGDDDADCYVVYCEANDTLYAVDGRDFDENISLRVDSVERERSDTDWASEYELSRNWPPGEDGTPPRNLKDPAVNTAIDRLEAAGYDVEFVDWADRRRTLLVATDDDRHRVRVEKGYTSNGRLRFNADGDEQVDYHLVYYDEADALYVVPDEEFDESISLRVEPPERVDGSINWADDYAFDDNWPPG